MLSAMQRRQGPGGDADSMTVGGPVSSSAAATGGGGDSVSFWSSLSVVDSLFSDDPPTRLGQTLSADHAAAFGGGGLSNGWHQAPPSSPASHQSHHLFHPSGGAHHLGGSPGALGLQRSSFDEGSFYSSVASSSLFSSSPILSPPSSPALHSIIYSSDEDHHEAARSHGGMAHHHLQQQQHHLHHTGGGGGGAGHFNPSLAAGAVGSLHSNGLHSTNGVMTRKHNYALYASGAAAVPATPASGGGSGKYSTARPGGSGLPNGAGHKHGGGGFGGGGGGGSHHYAASGGGYGQQAQFQYAGSGHQNVGGYHGQQQHGSGHFRASPPRSQPIHAPPRGSSGLGGSGGYPASPPARLRNSGGLGSMPRSSPPRQQHSYLSTALKSSAVNGSHQASGKYASASSINLYSGAAPTDGSNIYLDDEGLSPRGGSMATSAAVLSSPRLSSSPLPGSGSQPIQIARNHQHHQQQQQLTVGSSRSPSASSLVVSSPTSPQLSSYIGSLRLDDANETSGLLMLPSTTLLRIFGYLSGRDLGHLEQVCKRRLAYLANDDGLWKDLYLRRYKLLDAAAEGAPLPPTPVDPSLGDEDSASDEWAWIYSLLQQNERWKDIFKTRHSAEQWRIGSLKMFNGCWGFISQTPGPGQLPEQTLDIFFHRKDIAPDGDWYEDWWLKDTPGVSRSQKCGYWDTFLCGRIVRYKQRAAYAQGRRPQACNISFVGEERRDPITGEPLPALHDAKIAQRSLAAARFG